MKKQLLILMCLAWLISCKETKQQTQPATVVNKDDKPTAVTETQAKAKTIFYAENHEFGIPLYDFIINFEEKASNPKAFYVYANNKPGESRAFLFEKYIVVTTRQDVYNVFSVYPYSDQVKITAKQLEITDFSNPVCEFKFDNDSFIHLAGLKGDQLFFTSAPEEPLGDLKVCDLRTCKTKSPFDMDSGWIDSDSVSVRGNRLYFFREDEKRKGVKLNDSVYQAYQLEYTVDLNTFKTAKTGNERLQENYW